MKTELLTWSAWLNENRYNYKLLTWSTSIISWTKDRTKQSFIFSAFILHDCQFIKKGGCHGRDRDRMVVGFITNFLRDLRDEEIGHGFSAVGVIPIRMDLNDSNKQLILRTGREKTIKPCKYSFNWCNISLFSFK
jgi:hypothetical protein